MTTPAATKRKLQATRCRRLSALRSRQVLAEGRAEIARQALHDEIFAAFHDGGMSYVEIAETVGLSRIRVAQILRRERERRDAD